MFAHRRASGGHQLVHVESSPDTGEGLLQEVAGLRESELDQEVVERHLIGDDDVALLGVICAVGQAANDVGLVRHRNELSAHAKRADEVAVGRIQSICGHASVQSVGMKSTGQLWHKCDV